MRRRNSTSLVTVTTLPADPSAPRGDVEFAVFAVLAQVARPRRQRRIRQVRCPAPVTHGSTAAADGATNKVWMGPPRYRIRQRPGRSSPYMDPATGFLRNEVSANTQQEIDLASAELLPGRLEDLAKDPIPCTGDKAHLQAIHRVLFDGVFDWAGQFRTTDIDKQGTDFVPAGEVEAAIDQLFAELAAENLLRGLPRERFIARLAPLLRAPEPDPSVPGGQRTDPAPVLGASGPACRVVRRLRADVQGGQRRGQPGCEPRGGPQAPRRHAR